MTLRSIEDIVNRLQELSADWNEVAEVYKGLNSGIRMAILDCIYDIDHVVLEIEEPSNVD